MSHHDTRSVIRLGDVDLSGVEAEIGQAFNSVEIDPNNGNRLLFGFPDDNGNKTAVSVSGGGTAVQAYDSVSVSGNNIVFGKTDGSTADTQPLGGLTAITDLQTLTSGHTTNISTLNTTISGHTTDIATNASDISTLNTTVSGHTTSIDDLEAREQFKSVRQVPDLTASQIDSLTNPNIPLTVNGRTWHFEHSSSEPSVAQSVHSAFSSNSTRRWESYNSNANYVYNSLVSGSFYDYSGTNSIGGTLGEWITIQLPEAVILSSFTISADSSLSIPRSFKILGSVDGSSFDLLGEYTDVTVSTTDEGSNFKLDSTLSAYGDAYDYYAIVVTRVERFGAKQNVAIRHLRYFSVSKDVSRAIADVAEVASDLIGVEDLTGSSTLKTTIDGLTDELDNQKSREPFKGIIQHPDLSDAQMWTHNPTVNGRTYLFMNSSNEYQFGVNNYIHRYGFRTGSEYWLSDNIAGRGYNTLVSGSIYNYSGTTSLDGNSGEWLKVQLPEAVVLSSFTISAESTKSIPRSFKVLGSIDGSSFDLLGEYTDVTVSTTDEGSNFKLDSTLSAYGIAYDHYALIVTQVERVGADQNVAIRHLRYFSVSKDVSDTIARATTSFHHATITGTNTLNLIADSGTTSLTLPTGSTATSVDAITLNFTVQQVSGVDKYFLNGQEAGLIPIELNLQHKYIFTFPAGHPLKLSTEADGGPRDATTGVSLGNYPYTMGVTYASTQLTYAVQQMRLASNLYYYCENHANMGGAIIEDSGVNNIVSLTYDDTSVPKLVLERAWHAAFGVTPLDIPLSDSFVSAQKDGDNIKLTSISGTETTVGPFSGGGGATSTTNYPTSALTSNGGFSGTPPATITLTGNWGTSGFNLTRISYTTTSVIYNLYNPSTNLQFGGYGIVITIVSNQLRLYVNDSTHGTSEPTSFTINGNAASEGDVVTGNDTIALILTSPPGVTDTFTVPTELTPSTITPSASTEYNLFTDKLFGTDNLGNLGEMGGAHIANGPVDHWAFDPSDGNVIVSIEDGTNLKMIKITPDGALASVTYPERYVSPIPAIGSAADLITAWNSYSGSGGHSYTFTPHALFDLAVNNSPAYYAFDEDPTTEWVSHSNRYDSATGDYGNVFSGTPPATITLTGGWGTNGWNYVRTTYTNNYALYDLSVGTGYAIVFSINANNQLTLDVNDATHGTPGNPGSFSINGTMASNPDLISVGDTIVLFSTSGNADATFTVPTEFAVLGSSKLATTTDAGEYIKIDLDSAVEATTLNLKSIAEYKEPRINMTNYSQCGYEVTASSENSATSPVYLAFNNLTTPDTDKWISASNVYDATNGNYLPGGSQLSTASDSDGNSIPLGEYLMITFPDKRKLIGYTLTAQASGTAGTPKQFILYARETSTSTWVNLNSQSLTTALGSYVSGDLNTGGTRFDLSNPTTTAYQSFALVITHNFPAHLVHLNEFKLHCQPAEIENFKLYGSLNGTSWNEIHDQNTSANISSSGTEFTITNPGSYQHYGLVVTKNGGYHNVSLGEMKLGATDTVDLSNYYTKSEVYTKPEVNSLLPKGVLAEGSFTYVKNNSSTFAIAQANFFAASSNIGWTSSNVLLFSRHFGDPTIWAYAPACRQLIYQFTFTSPILDDDGQETSDYKVMLTRRDVSLSYLDTIYELAVHEKTPDYFKVRIELQVDTSTYHIETHGFDFVVF